MITVVTPFARIENKDLLIKVLEGKCNWIILQASDEPLYNFPSWVTVKRYDVTNKNNISNRLFNEFIASGLDDDTQYMILNDDDSVEEGFFEKIPNDDAVCTSMKRGDIAAPHMIFGDWPEYYVEDCVDILYAKPENMKIGKVGGEQLIIKGKILRNFRYGLNSVGDGEMIMKVVAEHPVTYVPDAYVLFNYFEDGRFSSFRRKPIVLFVGDYYCAGNKNMGISEWETNIWKSLESTELVNVGQFHLDKYYYHTGNRGDDALIERVKEIKPDFVVLVMYKEFGIDPTAINFLTITEMSKLTKIISIWGDLEASEQVVLSQKIAHCCYKVIGTANEEIASGLGYTYMHVPKDPRAFNNPNKERDIDVLFNGSFGAGREERREVLQFLLDNGIKLTAGGSEGGDHFSTEEYADRYKRAKIAISFSRARGKDVVNARPFEAMLCGAMIVAQKSEEMKKLWDEDVDYISWDSKEELLNVINAYLKNPEEIEEVAYNGQMMTQQSYSAKTFWEKVLS